MGKQRKTDSYAEFDRISERIQYFIITRGFSSYRSRLEVYNSIQADINALQNVLLRECLFDKLKAAGV